MTDAAAVCLTHADRAGSPCPRCGTFGCIECLEPGVCPACRQIDASRPPQPEEVQGFGRRAGARLIDIVVHQVLAVLAAGIGGITVAVLSLVGLGSTDALTQISDSLSFKIFAPNLAALACATVSTAVCGTSFGKAMLGLRVVSIDGTRPGFGPSVLRELGFFVDALFFGLVGKSAMDSSSLAQRHGDQWAKTVVVRSDATTGSGRASTAALVAGLLLSTMTYVACFAGFVVAFAL